jgi:signal transduction histidine kinase
LAAREPFRLEYRLRRFDGLYRWILDAGVARYTPDRTFAGYIGSAVDVTEHKIAQKALSNLSQKLMEAQEHERTRIARELHDDIGQRVALLTIDLDRLAQALPHESTDVRGHVAELGRRAVDLEKDVQAMSHRLHSSKLELLGIALAVAGFCRELAEQQRVVIDFTSEAIPEELRPDISLAVFRVLQEALTNAVKHAGVQRFQVRLRGTGNAIELEVSDAGVGFDPHTAMSGRGLGLISMTERLHLVGGELHIDSRPGAGTRVRARVPLDPADTSGVNRRDDTARRAG